MNTYTWYEELTKPSFAPPSWIFGPVWTMLYVIIITSFGYVIYLYTQKQVPFVVLLPFLLNILFNIIFTPIQFGMKNLPLASIDIVFVLITLIWALYAIFPFARWVTYINIPYLVWVSFASILQISITWLNK